MRAIRIIFGREIASYLRSPVGYIIGAIGLFANGIWFQAIALGGRPKLSGEVLSMFFFTSSIITMVMGLLLSFRLIAEERQQNTIVLLNTAPIREVEIVVGKFLASFVFLTLIILATAFIPAQIFWQGKIGFGQIAVGYLGLMLVGGGAIAVGIFGSSLTKNWLIAGAVSLLVGLLLIVGYFVADRLDPPLKTVVFQLDGWRTHFHGSFMRGALALKDIVYYFAVIYFFLLLATKTMEAKRWQ